VEDLPVNYRGLLALEGEKLTSQLFDDYAERQFAEQHRHRAIVTGFGLISPAIALRSLSMAAAGTDLDGHRRFLSQAEAYRYDIVQRLNRLQAEAVTFSDDSNRNKDPEAGRRVRIDPANWGKVPDFAYQPASLAEKLRSAAPGAAILLAWLIGAALLLRRAARSLEEAL
jgi:ABC-2 type transport system permease protein